MVGLSLTVSKGHCTHTAGVSSVYAYYGAGNAQRLLIVVMLHIASNAGDYFGELALLPGGNTRAATVRARTDVSLLVLDRPNFENLLGPLMPQLQAASKHYTGYKPKQGVQVGKADGAAWLLPGAQGGCLLFELGKRIRNTDQTCDAGMSSWW